MAETSDQLDTYFRTYLDAEPVQEPEDAEADPQLASVALTVIESIRRADTGVLFDIGCGKGVLFARLLQTPDFLNSNWTYLAIDAPEKLDVVQRLAREHRINRRLEVCALDDFYANWPAIETSSPRLLFCRNVFHELDVTRTAKLLWHISLHASRADSLIIQDVMNLREGERHNACWFPNELTSCVKAHGFDRAEPLVQRSKSGNRWFTLIADHFCRPGSPGSFEKSRNTVLSARRRQWDSWCQIEDHKSKGDEKSTRLVDVVDIDLQLTALTRQLRNEGVFELTLTPEIERRVRHSQFVKRVDSFVRDNSLVKRQVLEKVRLRERRDNLSALESFLRSNNSLIGLTGGPGVGKTSVLEHLLANRAYEKSPLILDGLKITDSYSFVEQFFGLAGLKLEPELLSVLTNLNWPIVEPPLRQFAKQFSRKIILAIDNFHELLNSNNQIDDPCVSKAIQILCSAEGAKVILAGRFASIPYELYETLAEVPSIEQVGLLEDDATVVSILDDHFDRASVGIQVYPARLIAAIDRHPSIADLTGQILRKRGPAVLEDDRFRVEVEQQFRDDLWRRLIDGKNAPAIRAASQLRIGVPLSLIEQLTTSQSIRAAIADSVLRREPDIRWQELISALRAFRLRWLDDDIERLDSGAETDAIDHNRTADLYLSIYREDNDPKWLREHYFHRLLSGDELLSAKTLGQYYQRELIASADYAFLRKQDYEEALNLYEIAERMGDLGEAAQMHRASCLIRIREITEGERRYARLFVEYPNNAGIRTSYIDALLAIGEDESALQQFSTLQLDPERNDYVATQRGRALLGLGRYPEAAAVFRRLLAKPRPSTSAFLYGSRAVQAQGANKEGIAILKRGRRAYPKSRSIAIALGAALTEAPRAEDSKETIRILKPIFDLRPDFTTAGLPLIRAYSLEGEFELARAVLKNAKKHGGNPNSSALIMAEAELLNAESKHDVAIQRLRTRADKDVNVLTMLLETYWLLASKEIAPNKRRLNARLALEANIPSQFGRNIPIQIIRCKLAALARDSEAFNNALTMLRQSRLDKYEINAIAKLWNTQSEASQIAEAGASEQK